MSMIICIGGSSRAGKTNLSNLIKAKIEDEGKSVDIIHMDEYVAPKDEMPLINNTIDWEDPKSIDHNRIVDKIENSTTDYIIIEGHLVFSFPQFISERNIFIEITKDEFYSRKKGDTRWGAIENWYIDHIWHSYEKYGKLYLDPQNSITVNGNSAWDLKSIMHFITENPL